MLSYTREEGVRVIGIGLLLLREKGEVRVILFLEHSRLVWCRHERKNVGLVPFRGYSRLQWCTVDSERKGLGLGFGLLPCAESTLRAVRLTRNYSRCQCVVMRG